MASIKKLLSKRKWTGKDVGKTLVACLMHDLKNLDKEDSTTLITQEEFSRLEASLTTEKDFITYRVYIALNEALREYYNKAHSYTQQVYHGFYRLFLLLGNSFLAQREARKRKQAPICMTPEQYSALAGKVMGSKSEKVRTKQELIFSLLRAYFATLDLESNPDPQEGHYSGNHAPAPIPDAIRKELDALAKKPATAKKALEAWHIEAGLGYYMLPDGRRKADMTPQEWQAALEEYPPAKGAPSGRERRVLEYSLLYGGADAIRAFYKDSTGEDLPPVEDKALLLSWDSITPGAPSLEDVEENDIDDALFNTLTGKLESALEGTSEYVLEWKRDDVELDVSKLDLLLDVLAYYEGHTGLATPQAGYSAFKKEYAALHAAIEQELLAAIPAWQDLKPAQLTKAAISCGELAKLGFLDYAEIIQPHEIDVIAALDKDCLAATIALVHDEKYSDVDKEGKLKERPLILYEFTLEALQEDASDINGSIEYLIKPAIKYILGYNAWLEIIAAAYDLPDITQGQVDMADIKSKVGILNSYMTFLYGAAASKERRAIAKRIFTPINFESLHPKEENILEVASHIEGLGYTAQAERALTLVGIDDMITKIAGL